MFFTFVVPGTSSVCDPNVSISVVAGIRKYLYYQGFVMHPSAFPSHKPREIAKKRLSHISEPVLHEIVNVLRLRKPERRLLLEAEPKLLEKESQ